MRRLPFDLLVPALVGVAVVAFAAGSSSVAGVVGPGRTLRWIALLALLAGAAAWAAVREERVSLRRSVLVAGVAFAGLAIESAAWSVQPRLTVERGGTVLLLFATAAALALATAGRPGAVERVLVGVLAGAAAVTLLGLVVLALDHSAAVEQATLDLPARYRGFGENPNTVSLLLALCLPVTVWFAFHAATRRLRILALATAIGFDASIVASGSRGGLAAGFAGVVVVLALAPRPLVRRASYVAIACVVLGASIAIALLPKSKGEGAAPRPTAPAAPSAPSRPSRYIDVQAVYPLEFAIGTMLPGQPNPTSRTLFGLTGRGEAWRGALDLADERPAAGYGFGTEDHVFVDRYANFAGGLPENSFIGTYLQLGALGLVALLGLVAALGVGAARYGLRRQGAPALGVIVAALVLAMVQSYIYSVGNIGTLTVWVCAALGGAVAARERAVA